MKVIIAAFLATALVVGPAGEASAASTRKKYRNPGPSYAYGYNPGGHSYRRRGASDGYYEQLLDAVPFGSRRWWDIWDRQTR